MTKGRNTARGCERVRDRRNPVSARDARKGRSHYPDGEMSGRSAARTPALGPIPARQGRCAMRGAKAAMSIGWLAIAIGLSPAISFDGTRTPGDATVAVPLPGSPVNRSADDLGSATPLAPVPLPPGAHARRQAAPSPYEAFRSGTQALRQ